MTDENKGGRVEQTSSDTLIDRLRSAGKHPTGCKPECPVCQRIDVLVGPYRLMGEQAGEGDQGKTKAERSVKGLVACKTGLVSTFV